MKNSFNGLIRRLDTAEKHGKDLQKLSRLKYKEKGGVGRRTEHLKAVGK